MTLWVVRAGENLSSLPLFEKYDVHLLLSSYAQAPSKFYVASVFYPPRQAEDAHEHLHHVAHREHAQETPSS